MVVWSIVSFDAEERAAKGSNPCRYYESRVLEVKSDGQKNQDHSWLLTVSASTCHSRDHFASPHLKRTLSPSCLTGSKKIWFILSVTCNVTKNSSQCKIACFDTFRIVDRDGLRRCGEEMDDDRRWNCDSYNVLFIFWLSENGIWEI